MVSSVNCSFTCAAASIGSKSGRARKSGKSSRLLEGREEEEEREPLVWESEERLFELGEGEHYSPEQVSRLCRDARSVALRLGARGGNAMSGHVSLSLPLTRP